MPSHPLRGAGIPAPEPRSAVFAQRTAEPRLPPGTGVRGRARAGGAGRGEGMSERTPTCSSRSTKVFLFTVPLLRSSGLRFRTALITNDLLSARLVTIPEFSLLTPSPPHGESESHLRYSIPKPMTNRQEPAATGKTNSAADPGPPGPPHPSAPARQLAARTVPGTARGARGPGTPQRPGRGAPSTAGAAPRRPRVSDRRRHRAHPASPAGPRGTNRPGPRLPSRLPRCAAHGSV